MRIRFSITSHFFKCTSSSISHKSCPSWELDSDNVLWSTGFASKLIINGFLKSIPKVFSSMVKHTSERRHPHFLHVKVPTGGKLRRLWTESSTVQQQSKAFFKSSKSIDSWLTTIGGWTIFLSFFRSSSSSSFVEHDSSIFLVWTLKTKRHCSSGHVIYLHQIRRRTIWYVDVSPIQDSRPLLCIFWILNGHQ